MRLVAVLGYSDRRTEGLHPICVQRLRHAEALVTPRDVVLLSGSPEAELMRDAWRGPDVRLLTDDTPVNTSGNASSVAAAAGLLGTTEVTVVTSWWHAFRAGTLVRAALPGASISSSPARGRPPVRLLVRELVCLLGIPFQVWRLREMRPA